MTRKQYFLKLILLVVKKYFENGIKIPKKYDDKLKKLN